MVSHGAAEAVLLSLHQGSLFLQDRQRLLQPRNLCCTPLLAGGISLRLGNAAVLDLCIILIHCAELCVGGLAVCRVFGCSLVLRLGLLGLVLDRLILSGLGDSILLSHLLVLRRGFGLLRLLLG